MVSKESFDDALKEIEHTLNYLAGIGCHGFDSSKESLDTLESWANPARPQMETLTAIRLDLGDCRRCKLSKDRKNIVFGAGNRHASLVFVGEGPGYEEDRQGEPFVGAAGNLLTKIIQAMNLSRNEVYICNIVKCRPPGNRNPEMDEIKACSPFLERQIEAIQPRFICALGTFAAQTLLESTVPISKLRGHFYTYKGTPVLPTYHPAYLLRNAEKKRDVWEDMKLLMKKMS